MINRRRALRRLQGLPPWHEVPSRLRSPPDNAPINSGRLETLNLDEVNDIIEERDDGPGSKSPVRTCVATRERLPVEKLIRFVADPDGVVVPDLKHKLPGRGVWVSADRASVAAAVQKKAFARSLRAPVKAGPELAELVETLLCRDALQALAIANKAGTVIAGQAKIEAAIATGGIRAILHAKDAAADGIRKLGQALRRRFGATDAPMVMRPFQSAQMSLCLGREHVIHVCLVEGSGRPGMCLATCRTAAAIQAACQVTTAIR